MGDHWTDLSFYESTDFVRRFFKSKHERELSLEKAREIVSHFAQGREYFQSAKKSSDLVRPLLLYYGVLAFVRGLILFLDMTKRETSLKNSHGLEVINWGNELSRGIETFPDLKIRITNGTFLEFCSTSKNVERVEVYTDPLPEKILIKREGTVDPSGMIITIKDIISRIPELIDIYEVTFNEFSNCLIGQVYVQSTSTQTHLSILETKLGLQDPAILKEILNVPETAQVQLLHSNSFVGDVRNYCFDIAYTSAEDLYDKLPPVINDCVGSTYIVAPINKNINLSKLSLLLLYSYSIGMLVRYYPSHWMSIIGKAKGDFVFPLIKSGIEVLENRFPYYILEELRN